MRGLVCYYSSTGNTRLVSRYAARKLAAAEWTLCDLIQEAAPDLNPFGAVMFVCPTDFWSVPERVIRFIRSLPLQTGRPAFVLATYGMMGAFALRDLGRLVRKRGFKIIGAAPFHTPENYPPLIVQGLGMKQSPSEEELRRFDRELSQWNARLQDAAAGRPVRALKPGEGLASLLPAPGRATARRDMGEKFVDESLCSQCGTCQKGCPYQAIQLAPFPAFNQAVCYGCWRCFNRCPKKAIYTKKFREQGRYPRPEPALEEKLR
ncbi:MAG: EFR1 family ferrodoxin [candidate division FCPU426 bacterium]